MECDQEKDCNNMLNIDEVPSSDSSESTETAPPRKKKRSAKTSKEQFEKLLSFMKSHSDFTRRKADENLTLDWIKCCKELNSMGPANHSPKGWRKVWSDYKGKKKGMVIESIMPILPIDVSSPRSVHYKDTQCSTSNFVPLKTVFESILPIDVISSGTVQYKDTQCSTSTFVPFETLYESILPIDVSSSRTDQHMGPQCSTLSSEDVTLQDDTVLKRLDTLVELQCETNRHLKDIKELLYKK